MSTDTQGEKQGDKQPIISADGDAIELIREHGALESPIHEDGQPQYEEGVISTLSTHMSDLIYLVIRD